MSKRRITEAEIIAAIHQVDAGRTCVEVAREIGVSKHTIYAWKAKYSGGLNVNAAQRLRQLDEENRPLKQLVADLSLDAEILKSVIDFSEPASQTQPVLG